MTVGNSVHLLGLYKNIALWDNCTKAMPLSVPID